MSDALDPMAVPLVGTTLIEASAGTGKTHAIATLFVRLLLEQRLAVDEILVVTFTEAAAAELRDRVRSRVRAALDAVLDRGSADPDLERLFAGRVAQRQEDLLRLVTALRSFDLAPISTIHGFCQRVLQHNAFETGVPLSSELVVDETPLVDTVVRDFWAQQLYDADPRFVIHLQQAKVVPSRLLRLARLAASRPDLPLVPARTSVDDDPDASAFVSAYREVRALWHREGAAVQALLLGTKVLHRTHYDPEQMPAWFSAMDAFLRAPDPGALLQFGGLARFSADTLAARTNAEGKRRGLTPKHEFFDACAELERARAPLVRNYDQRMLAFKTELARFVRRELPKRKRAAGLQSFDDLLLSLDSALRSKSGKRLAEQIRRRHRAALIDEFQDTDPIQYRIFRTLFGARDRTLLLIGDPKQAIYGFRGADVFAYLEAARTTGKRRITMRHNWRSDPALLVAIDRLFGIEHPFLLEEITLPPVLPRPGAKPRLFADGAPLPALSFAMLSRTGAELKGRHLLKEWAEAVIPERIADDIAALLARGATIDEGERARPVHAGDIAVLTRKNAQALLVQQALRRRGIPSVVYGDSTVFETREAGELARVLSAAAEPTHVGLLRSALATELVGVAADQLVRLDEDDASWEHWVECFRKLHELWTMRGFISAFRALLQITGAQARLLAQNDGERRMTNLLHLAELLHAESSNAHLGPAGLLRWLDEQRRLKNPMVEAFKLRLERDERAVQLVTIHRSKGLEYPIVYVPYAWDGEDLRNDDKAELLYHDPEAGLSTVLDVRRADDPAKQTALGHARREHDAEALRLLYVAVTRARHRCVVVWAASTRAYLSGLGRLLWSPLPTSRIHDASDAEMFEHIRERGQGAWTIDWLSPDPLASTGAPAPEPGPATTLAHRRPRAAIDRLWRTSSFSHMASAQALAGPLFVDFTDVRAHDEALVPDELAPWSAPRPASGPAVPLATFPRGVRAGNFFHDLLEHLEFDAEPELHHARAVETLRAHGYDGAQWSSVVDDALAAILATPLSPTAAPGLELRRIARRVRLDELEFILPVAGADTALGRRAIAQVLREHPEGLPVGYAERVAQLGFLPLRGFLKGFIDMVFVHEGRWYLVDYKTNHLGDLPDDYRHDQLAVAMADDHYVLQYHLYLVALVRFLALRQPGFDYERDFGGVMYLFLRGMSPSHGDVGIWRERPPKARIDALSRLFSRTGGET